MDDTDKRELTPAEVKMRTRILEAIQDGMNEGLHAADITISALSLAMNCAESCIVACKPGKETLVREGLVKAVERIVEHLRTFEPPKAQSGAKWDDVTADDEETGDAWDAKR